MAYNHNDTIYMNGGAETDYESDPYDAYESYDESSSSDEFSRNRKGRGHSGAIQRRLYRMQQQINGLRRHLQRISQQAGNPAYLTRRLAELERTTDNMRQSQLLAQLLDVPQLESIRYAGDDEAREVEHSSFDKQSVLLLQMLNQQGGASTGGTDMKCLLPLLLLQNEGGDQGGGMSNLLLLTLLNK